VGRSERRQRVGLLSLAAASLLVTTAGTAAALSTTTAERPQLMPDPNAVVAASAPVVAVPVQEPSRPTSPPAGTAVSFTLVER
jgi:hypothetical protein